MSWWRDWVTLLQLARRRCESDQQYRQFQAYQGSLLVSFLQQQGIDLQQRVLDLGCGNGGYTQALGAAGAQVIALDRIRPLKPVLFFIQGDAITLPFADESLPFVFCASLIEHVPHPRRLLAEIRRILYPGGSAYISFPPFYSPVGGHQFKPYHLLGERVAIRMARSRRQEPATGYSDGGLYPLTIRQVRGMIGEAGLQITNMSTRFMPLNMARIPLAGEFLTWHVQFIARKPASRAGASNQSSGC